MSTQLIERAKKYYNTEGFHTWEHAQNCMNYAISLMENIGVVNADRVAVLLALAYHDAHYVPGNKDNELKSAIIMTKECHAVSNYILEQAFSAILATGQYAQPGFTTDSIVTRVVLDSDLYQLSLPYSEFRRNQKLIAKEYKCYLSEQAEFLMKTFYFRPIYNFHDDAPAKENIRQLFGEEA